MLSTSAVSLERPPPREKTILFISGSLLASSAGVKEYLEELALPVKYKIIWDFNPTQFLGGSSQMARSG